MPPPNGTVHDALRSTSRRVGIARLLPRRSRSKPRMAHGRLARGDPVTWHCGRHLPTTEVTLHPSTDPPGDSQLPASRARSASRARRHRAGRKPRARHGNPFPHGNARKRRRRVPPRPGCAALPRCPTAGWALKCSHTVWPATTNPMSHPPTTSREAAEETDPQFPFHGHPGPWRFVARTWSNEQEPPAVLTDQLVTYQYTEC